MAVVAIVVVVAVVAVVAVAVVAGSLEGGCAKLLLCSPVSD